MRPPQRAVSRIRRALPWVEFLDHSFPDDGLEAHPPGTTKWLRDYHAGQAFPMAVQPISIFVKKPKILGKRHPKRVPMIRLGRQKRNKELRGHKVSDREVVATKIRETMRQKTMPPITPQKISKNRVIFTVEGN